MTEHEHSDDYNFLVTLAKDLDKLGHKFLTPAKLIEIAEAIEAGHIMRESGFDDMETLEDFSL